MPALTFYSPPRADRSFTIGLGVIIVLAAAELCSFGLFYASKIRPAHAAAAPPKAAPAPAAVASRATPAAPPPVAQASANPVSPPSTSVLSTSDRLLKEVAALRERGDTTTALARLQQASEKDPKNAQVLAEMATIYESILNFDRSNETWRRIQEIGPSAGASYELAVAKLKSGVAAATAPTSPEQPAAPSTPTDAIPNGAVLGISDISETENPDPDAETDLLLKISVKRRADVVIDHTKVKIQVYFYDSLPEPPPNNIKLTDADVSYEWLTPNHDWADTNTEILAVTYVRPKNKALSSEAALAAAAAGINPTKKGKLAAKPGPVPDSSQRKYLGYIVRISYNDQLQDQRAVPTKLLTLFPSSNTNSP